SSRRRHTRWPRDWSSDVCSSDLLAALAARALEMELAVRGFAMKIRVCSTRLEEMKGQWTGRIAGEAMFGQAKARAVAALADQWRSEERRVGKEWRSGWGRGE